MTKTGEVAMVRMVVVCRKHFKIERAFFKSAFDFINVFYLHHHMEL